MRLTLPRMMQTHIYCHLEGKYRPDFKAAQQNLLSDEAKLLTYLGTYFPRSFAEYYYITNQLLANLDVRRSWEKLKSIRILDIGSGTGGNLMGFIHALRRYTDLVDIEVVSLDGNLEALNLQEKVIAGCYDKEISFIPQVVKFTNLLEFKSQLQGVLKDNAKFDAVLCSKSLSEIYLSEEFEPFVSRWDGSGYYKELFSFSQGILKLQGLMIVSDVTVLVPKLGLFIPNILNVELKNYLQIRQEDGLRCILPQSCAHWAKSCVNPRQCFNQKTLRISHTLHENDICKFTFRVLAHRDYAHSLMRYGDLESNVYGVAEDGIQNVFNVCVNGRCGSVKEHPGLQWLDAFSLGGGTQE